MIHSRIRREQLSPCPRKCFEDGPLVQCSLGRFTICNTPDDRMTLNVMHGLGQRMVRIYKESVCVCVCVFERERERERNEREKGERQTDREGKGGRMGRR